MRRAIACVVLMLSLLGTGCMTVYSIHKERGEKEKSFFSSVKCVKGIPFFTKTSALVQTTVYSRTWLEVEFTLGSADPKANTALSSETKIVRLRESTVKPDLLDRGIAAAKNSATTATSIQDVVSEFRKACTDSGGKTDGSVQIHEITPEEFMAVCSSTKVDHEKFDETFISDIKEIETYVDYTTPYYFNVRVPLFGKSNATLDIQTDGTISKTTADVDATKLADVANKVLETAFSLAPMAMEILTTPRDGSGNREAATKLSARSLTVSASQKGYLYEISRTYSSNFPIHKNEPRLEFGDEGISVKRTDLNKVAETPASGDKAKDDSSKNAYVFQGSVKLPEQQSEKKPAQ
jgi:hypothetical protein